MRAVIIGNGEIRSYEKIRSYIKDGDFIVCADGGIKHASELGVIPDILIGDFDSSDPDELKCDAKCIVYPTRKDFTDGELCIRYANERGFDEVMLLGMTGSRADHTLTNLLLLSQCSSGCAVNEDNEIYYIKNRIQINNKKGMTLSIIPLRGNLRGITTKGLEYPLNNDTLYFGESRGNSNVITSDSCEIEVKDGEGIIIINNGD